MHLLETHPFYTFSHTAKTNNAVILAFPQRNAVFPSPRKVILFKFKFRLKFKNVVAEIVSNLNRQGSKNGAWDHCCQ